MCMFTFLGATLVLQKDNRLSVRAVYINFCSAFPWLKEMM